MIPSAKPSIKKLHQFLIETKKLNVDYLREVDPKHLCKADKEAIEQENIRCKGWKTLFDEAKQVANIVNIKNHGKIYQREIDDQDVINHWYLDLEAPQMQTRNARKDDKVTEFRTISQELRDLEEKDNRLAYELWEQCYRKWWHSGKVGIKPILPKPIRYAIVTTEDFDTYGTGAWSEQQDDVESLEYEREQKQGFFQSDSEDPENPFEDDYGCRRLGVRHRKQGDFKFYRGSRGVLNGLYSNTNPEPNYRDYEARKEMITRFKESTDPELIKIAKMMKRTIRANPEWLAKKNLKKREQKIFEHSNA